MSERAAGQSKRATCPQCGSPVVEHVDFTREGKEFTVIKCEKLGDSCGWTDKANEH